MIDNTENDAMVEGFWRKYLTTGEFEKETRQRKFFRMLPGHPRCKNCYAPFRGIGSRVVHMRKNTRVGLKSSCPCCLWMCAAQPRLPKV